MDSLVETIGKIPFRLTMQAFSRKPDTKALTRYFERIRDTFQKHTPAIMIGEHIGSGGFADVFKAASNYDGITDFAIKILRADLLTVRKGNGSSPQEEEMRVKDMKKRFTNESYVQWDLSKSLSDTVSRSVVKVFDFGEFDNRNNFRFILMEQMGLTLRNFLNDGKNTAETRDMLLFKTRLMLTIAEMVSNVHTEGIFHRDIKPENILFPRSFILPDFGAGDPGRRGGAKKIEVKLADFGTVRWVKSYTSKYDGMIIGSQFYMSPEQIYNPENLDQRTDIYSFGIVAYELLYGAHPKSVNKNTTNVLSKLAGEKPVARTPPRGFEDLNEIVIKCMGNIQERYQSMEHVVTDLRAFYERAAGQGPKGPPQCL
jgi:serine/threonine protein kinase